MATQILMPALSPTMTEGKLSRWLKHVGDEVHAGDVIAEIETDKATMEVEAIDEGTIGKILVPEGAQDIAVNAPIASTSIVALSVSISAMTSPGLTVSPSFFSHLARLPFSMVGERAGIRMLVGIGSRLGGSLTVGDGLHRLDHLGDRGQRQLLEVGRIGHRDILAGHLEDRRVEPIESPGHDL